MVVGGLFFNALWRASIRDRSCLRPEVTEAEVRSMIKQMQEAMHIFEVLELPEQVAYYQEHFDKFVKV